MVSKVLSIVLAHIKSREHGSFAALPVSQAVGGKFKCASRVYMLFGAKLLGKYRNLSVFLQKTLCALHSVMR